MMGKTGEIMMEQDRALIVISPQTVFLVFGLLFAIWLLVNLQKVIVLVFIAWLFAATLYPAVSWLEKRKWPKGLSIGLFYSICLALLGGLFFFMGDVLATQITELINDFPALMDRASRYVSSIPGIRRDFQLEAWLTEQARTLAFNVQALFKASISYVFSLLSAFLGVFTVLVLTFLMLMKPKSLEDSLVRLFPLHLRPRAIHFMETVSGNVGRFIRGQTMVAASIALLTGIGLAILGVEYVLVLALLAFVLDFIPIIGSLLAAVFAILVALGQNPLLALWTAILYIVVNQLEANVIGPLIVGKAVGLGPFWIIFSILAGGTLYGIPGAFLAIPVAVIIKLVIDEFYIPDVVQTPPTTGTA
jgi:predicted PurR-regulated permease PerM